MNIPEIIIVTVSDICFKKTWPSASFRCNHTVTLNIAVRFYDGNLFDFHFDNVRHEIP